MPLVVGGSPVAVDQREIVGQHDAVAHLGSSVALDGEVLDGDAYPGTDHRTVGEIGQDAQEHLAVGDGLDQARDALAHAVHGVGAHRVARVDQ